MRGCKGALLLVDVMQGVQAQTFSNYEYAREEGLRIIPVLNKIDVPSADPDLAELEMQQDLGLKTSPIRVSAKTGQGVDQLLAEIVREVPPPDAHPSENLSLFLLNSWYEQQKGVVCLFQVRSGVLRKGISVTSANLSKNYQVFEVGLLQPGMAEQAELTAGMIGYATTNMKEVGDARIGDTFFQTGVPMRAFKGFEPASPVVFAGLYSVDASLTHELEKNLHRLALKDPAVKITKESSAALGHGFKVGFLGMLHMDIFRQRLEEEHGSDIIVTTPSVPYRCTLDKGDVLEVENAGDCPAYADVRYFEEPMVLARIKLPEEAMAGIVKMCTERRGR